MSDNQEGLSREHMIKMIRAQTVVMKQVHEDNLTLQKENAELRDALSKVLAQVRMRSMQRHILEADEVQWVSELLNKGE